MQFNPRIVPCYSFLSDISPFRNLGWLPKFLNLFRDSSIKKVKNSSKFSIINHSIKTLQYPPANYFTIEIKNYPYISPYRKMKNPFTEGNSITKVTRKGWKEIPPRHPEKRSVSESRPVLAKGRESFIRLFLVRRTFFSHVCENYTYRKEGEATGLPVVSRALVNARRYPHPPIQGWNVRVCTTRRG